MKVAIVPKGVRYVGINLTKEVEDSEKCKTLMKLKT